jgi:hypothetical protein
MLRVAAPIDYLLGATAERFDCSSQRAPKKLADYST